MWLDADTTFITRRSLKEIGRAVRRFDALFVHANLRFTLDWTRRPMGRLPGAAKAVALNEIYRRQNRRMNRKNVEYIEESGLAFALGTYLRAGGLETGYSGESYTVIGGVRTKFADDPNGFEYFNMRIRRVKVLPKPIVRKARSSRIPLVHYIGSARIGTSARRHYETVRRQGVKNLTRIDTHGYEGPHASGKERPARSVRVTRDAVHEAIRNDLSRIEGRAAEQNEKIHRMIDRAFGA